MADKPNKFGIKEKESYQTILKNGDVIKGKASRLIPESGFIIKTLYPTKMHYLSWKIIKSVKKSQEMDIKWRSLKESIAGKITSKKKDEILKAEKVLLYLRGESMVSGKINSFYGDMLHMESELLGSLYFNPEDITAIEKIGERGKRELICSNEDEEETESEKSVVKKRTIKKPSERRNLPKTTRKPRKKT